jgi:PilZ domain-containing protein
LRKDQPERALSDKGKPVARLGRKATGQGDLTAGLPKKESVAMAETRKAAVVRALHALQERLTAAHLAGRTTDDGALAQDFNALLLQAKEQFPRSDTLRLIEPVGAGATAPVLAVRLVLMRRTLDADLEDGPAGERNVDERRRWQRRDVAWSARFLVGEGAAVAGRAVDASRHGLRLVLDGGAPAGLEHGQKCCVEVHLAGSSARFVREAEVCHVDDHGIGLAIAEALPAGLVPPPAEAIVPSAKPGAPARRARPGLGARLRGFLAW